MRIFSNPLLDTIFHGENIEDEDVLEPSDLASTPNPRSPVLIDADAQLTDLINHSKQAFIAKEKFLAEKLNTKPEKIKELNRQDKPKCGKSLSVLICNSWFSKERPKALSNQNLLEQKLLDREKSREEIESKVDAKPKTPAMKI